MFPPQDAKSQHATCTAQSISNGIEIFEADEIHSARGDVTKEAIQVVTCKLQGKRPTTSVLFIPFEILYEDLKVFAFNYRFIWMCNFSYTIIYVNLLGLFLQISWNKQRLALVDSLLLYNSYCNMMSLMQRSV